MTPEHIKALERFAALLNEYEDDSGTSVLDEPDIEAINPGHPIHNAAVEVERHYGGKLPVEARHTWKELLRSSRAGQREAWRLAGEMKGWVETAVAGKVNETASPSKPLTPTEYGILQQLAKASPQLVKITDLACDLNCGRSAATEAVKRLVSYKYVDRSIGTRSGVTITPAGRSALRPADRPANARLDDDR